MTVSEEDFIRRSSDECRHEIPDGDGMVQRKPSRSPSMIKINNSFEKEESNTALE